MRSISAAAQRAFEILTEGSWITYFTCGTLAILMSWAMSGCRIGNRTVNAAPADTMSGVYEITPQTFTLTAQLSTSTNPLTISNVSFTDIPTAIQQVLSNPVALLVQNTSTGAANLFNPASSAGSGGSVPALPVTVNMGARTFSAKINQSEEYNSSCTEADTLTVSGQLNSTDAGTTVGQYPISGHSPLLFTMGSVFTGCSAVMVTVMNCYSDTNTSNPTQCGQTDASDNQALQQYFQQLFGPFIQSGLLTANQIQDITSMGYQVYYQ